MKVLKFGGTSVGSAEGLEKAISVVLSQKEDVVVVFSAFSGVTNMLAECLDLAASGDTGFRGLVREIGKRHFAMTDMVTGKEEVKYLSNKIVTLTTRLQESLEGIFLVGEKTIRSADLILGFGELLSIELIHSVMKCRMEVVHIDAREMIFTRFCNGREMPDLVLCESSIKNMCTGRGPVIITSGYISRSVNGYPATLGRGGSDYTAAIIASALDASMLEIWTDVSGIYTADPRYSSDAYPIAELSYSEALELSHFGAKVIYPPTIQPVLRKKIPVLVKNTFACNDPGTLVVEKPGVNGTIVKAVSAIDEVTLVSLTGPGMAGVAGIASRLFSALAREYINVILITQASSEQSICIAVEKASGGKARDLLNDEFNREIENGRVRPVLCENGFSIVAMVGEGMRHSVGICGQAFSALGRNGINIHAIAQGSSELNVSVVVKKSDCRKTVNAIHQEFFHSVSRTVNLFIVGTGTVGSALVRQVIAQHDFFVSNYQLDIRVIGLANSRRMLIDPEGISDPDWKALLMSKGSSMELSRFTDQMFSLNLPDTIFIDNTASEKVSSIYERVLSKSVSVVTCNKIAASSSYRNYSALKKTAVERRVHFRFESNVGAGLPIIQTISNLVKTGDRVRRIEAVISGSLNFIFNNFCNDLKFSEAVLKAVKEGFTEPDPLVDLRGTDVSRKLLILVREAGIKLEASDITMQNYLPGQMPATYDPSLFREQMEQYDSYFEDIRRELASQRMKLRVVASYAGGEASVSLRKVDGTHPFFNLEGNDNIVSVISDRYPVSPLVIKGAGAGADVTASGIFSDILAIINN